MYETGIDPWNKDIGQKCSNRDIKAETMATLFLLGTGRSSRHVGISTIEQECDRNDMVTIYLDGPSRETWDIGR